jgi:hypothetical protein
MNHRLAALLCIVCLVVLSCHDDDDENPAPNVVFIEEDIDTPQTWSGNTIYIIVKYDFYVTSTLTIQPGAIIKFHPSDGPYMMLGGSGVVNAQGTEEDPIIFTSYLDDAHGGDNNDDGNATQPEPRDWGGIHTNGNNGSTFRYCEFYYGGSVLYHATLTLYGNNITVENCRFIDNDGSSDHVGVLDASDAGTGTVIRNNIFYGNVRPLSISGAFDIDDSNIFHNPGQPSETNDLNGIFVDLLYYMTTARQWRETEVAFVMDGYQRYIDTGGSLTLGNNVVIKFQSTGELWLEEGAGQLINHDGEGVYFTSYKDDSRKGDTNGDGNASSPASGDWSGIYDNSLSLPAPHFYSWGNILYDSY